MTDTEAHYAQIEKETLALIWACERFSMYLLRKCFLLETNQKPHVSLLSSKNQENLPLHILRFRLRMMRYNFTIVHVQGKALVIADALSRAPVHCDVTESQQNKYLCNCRSITSQCQSPGTNSQSTINRPNFTTSPKVLSKRMAC